MKSSIVEKEIVSRRDILIMVIQFFIFTFCGLENTMAQQKNQMVRLAKIEVDPAKIEAYNAALKSQMAAAIKLEPGVLTYYAVADKTDPAHITILEIYADTAAYQHHITTTHFKKYKTAVAGMVKSLQLVDVDMIGYARKPEM